MHDALRLQALSDSQRAAVTSAAERPLQILAGPGSGKTRVLTTRVAWLVLGGEERAPVAPHQCVVVTFTNKAAAEMRSRLNGLIGEENTRMLVLGTFHATCARYLRRHGHRIAIDTNFTIADMDDGKRIVKEVLDQYMDRLKEGSLTLKPEQALAEISKAKSKCLTPKMLAQVMPASSAVTKEYNAIIAAVYSDYQARLHENNALDFDDLLMRGAQLFREHPSVGSDIRHVLVDEFQDTNAVQYELMCLMASATGHVSVVGDPDQSIYSWRNAEVGNLEKMYSDFPGLHRVLLEENFRSTKAILDASLKLVRQDTERIDKGLFTSKGAGAPVSFRSFPSADLESEYIALEIQRHVLLAQPLLSYSDVCILLRYNALSRSLESALQRLRIPYRVMGGPKFFDRAEVKDLLAYLLLVDNKAYTPALLRIINVPRRGIGAKSIKDLAELAQKHSLAVLDCVDQMVDGNAALSAGIRPTVLQGLKKLGTTLRRLREAAHEGMPVPDLLQLLISEVDFEAHLKREEDYASRWENVQELISFAASCDTGMYDTQDSWGEGDGDERAPKRARKDMAPTPLRIFLENSMLASDTAAGVDGNEMVTISTCHAAKGLEWPVVFVPAVEEGIFPFYRSVTADEQREERRLLYVAMTRAATNLYLSHTRRRLVAGEWHSRTLSHFLAPLIPKARSGTQPPGAPRHQVVDWCFGVPDVSSAFQDVASVLQRPMPEQDTLSQNQAAYAASATARRLSEMHEDEMKPETKPSPPMYTSGPRPASSGFASALNSLGSSALSGTRQGNVRAANPLPSQLGKPGRSLGLRRGPSPAASSSGASFSRPSASDPTPPSRAGLSTPTLSKPDLSTPSLIRSAPRTLGTRRPMPKLDHEKRHD